jgi:hypothetical protein
MPPTTNPKTIQPNDITDAKKALKDATDAITAAQASGTMPLAGNELPLNVEDGTYQKLNDAKSDIQSALSALGGKPCGGGRPC